MKKYRSWLLVCLATGAALLTLAHAGSRAVDVIAGSSPIPRSHCIVIDAGHGGVDGGAVSCTGLPESGYNLEIALKLNDLFRFLGYDTRMIRTSDVSVYTKGETIAQKKISDLKERVRIVNTLPNALLLSIHQNTYPDSRYRGTQVFYAGTRGSKALAERLQADVSAALDPENHRESKKSTGVYLMEHIECPGVLVECGFLSNLEEEARLRDQSYQQKLCGILAVSTAAFLSNT